MTMMATEMARAMAARAAARTAVDGETDLNAAFRSHSAEKGDSLF
jgi:hypothetical protein